MSGVNKAIIVGNVGRDPEVRFTGGGQAVANFTVATTEKWTDKGGEKQEKTEWHRIVVWGKLAEICGQYVTKGRQVYVEGRLETREWTNKEGAKQYTTEINARDVQFLGKGDGAATGADEGFGPPPPDAVPASRPASPPASRAGLPTTFPNFGRSKNQPIAGASSGDLDFYEGASKRTLADPSKERWHSKERDLLAAYAAERASPSSSPAAPAQSAPDEEPLPF